VQLPVFAAEREAGLEQLILSTASISYASIVEVAKPFELSNRAKARLALGKDLYQALATNEGQFDLHYLKSILVSVGWNKNDDVFDLLETWAARHSPEDKPFNFEHKQDDIIGHITGNYVIDADGKVIADDTLVDKLPSKFHIVTAAVLYKAWSKEELQKRMDQILAEIPQGKWYVSMEALFRNFDYALIKADGSAHIVPRTDKTAFLTKHLRAYGGDGKYQDQKVGRVLRHITFSGKGLVRKPANPESIIFAEIEPFQSSASEIPGLNAELGYGTVLEDSPQATKGDKPMASEIEIVQKQNAELTAKVEKLEAQLRENDTKTLQAKATQLETELKAQAEQFASLKGESEKLKADLTKAASERDEATKSLAKIEADRKHEKRIQTVVAKLGKTAERAESFVKALASLSDADFDAHIEAEAADYEAQKKAGYTGAEQTVEDNGDKSEMNRGGKPVSGKPSQPTPVAKVNLPQYEQLAKPPISPTNLAGNTAPVNTPPGTVASETEETIDTSALDQAQPENKPTLAAVTTDSGVLATQKAVAAYFGVKTEDE
jgi:Skp family chaperone for outer membrane proteins